MFDPVKDIEEFHRKFDLLYEGKPRLLDNELSKFRCMFLQEELNEYESAAVLANHQRRDGDMGEVAPLLEDQLDALVDLVYVALGTAHLHGFNFREAWRRVHEANMQKVRAATPEDSSRHSTFDVVKPEGWKAPDHSDLVEDHAHLEERNC